MQKAPVAWLKLARPCRRWRPAYLQPAADAARFGYLSGERGGIAAQQVDGAASSGCQGSSPEASGTAPGGTSSSISSGSSTALVNPDDAVFLGLAPETGAPVFAADLGPPPPLLPDASRAAAASAAAFPQVLTRTAAWPCTGKHATADPVMSGTECKF